MIIDADQHLFEGRATWLGYIDPQWRDDAVSIEDDQLGWPWLVWRGKRVSPVEVQVPGRPNAIGDERRQRAHGLAAPGRYEERLPAAYADPTARLAALDRFGVEATLLFPNFGLLYEETLADDVPALCANLRAFNRWMADSVAVAPHRLFGVGHLTLRDRAWAVEEIARIAAAGLRLAMIAPAPVDGKPLSHPELDPVWAAFCEHGVAPVFHVGAFLGPLDPAWYQGESEPGDRLLDSVFLHVAPAVALANLIIHGTLERFPALRIGVVELTANWVPGFLLNLDGAIDFYVARHGAPICPLRLRASEYFYRQVRVSALAYERPAHLVSRGGEDVFMFGSDWPHAEGIAEPLADYQRAVPSLTAGQRYKLFGGNASWLVGAR